jgi:superfamily I DNA and/or RNA helicase
LNGRRSKDIRGWLNRVSGSFQSTTREIRTLQRKRSSVSRLLDSLVETGVNWNDEKGRSRPLRLDDVLIVAPYNAQVSDLAKRIPKARVGTVDKFQGQQAPVVIYSLTTSGARVPQPAANAVGECALPLR